MGESAYMGQFIGINPDTGQLRPKHDGDISPVMGGMAVAADHIDEGVDVVLDGTRVYPIPDGMTLDEWCRNRDAQLPNPARDNQPQSEPDDAESSREGKSVSNSYGADEVDWVHVDAHRMPVDWEQIESSCLDEAHVTQAGIHNIARALLVLKRKVCDDE